jgi:hypothetical protein
VTAQARDREAYQRRPFAAAHVRHRFLQQTGGFVRLGAAAIANEQIRERREIACDVTAGGLHVAAYADAEKKRANVSSAPAVSACKNSSLSSDDGDDDEDEEDDEDDEEETPSKRPKAT